jgi:hypothetical protein
MHSRRPPLTWRYALAARGAHIPASALSDLLDSFDASRSEVSFVINANHVLLRIGRAQFDSLG